jgi:hypothetical protein
LSKSTTLASARVNGSEIIIELQSSAGTPPFILVTWPPQASTIAPVRFNAVASDVAKLFARAATALTQIRRDRRSLSEDEPR